MCVSCSHPLQPLCAWRPEGNACAAIVCVCSREEEGEGEENDGYSVNREMSDITNN